MLNVNFEGLMQIVLKQQFMFKVNVNQDAVYGQLMDEVEIFFSAPVA